MSYRNRLGLILLKIRRKIARLPPDDPKQLNSSISALKIKLEKRSKQLARRNAEVTALKTQVRILKRELRKIPRHRYGSYTPGRDEWASRWDNSSHTRVLFYTFKDAAGSFYRWADALNRYTNYAVRMATPNPHSLGYPDDIILPHSHVQGSDSLCALINEADIIHIKDEEGIFNERSSIFNSLLVNSRKPIVFTAHGSGTRRLADNSEFREFVKRFDARVAMTPDLNPPWMNATFIPQAIDESLYAYCWQDGKCLAHSPATRSDKLLNGRKATVDLLQAVEGLDIFLDLINGVSHSECMKRKKAATLFFDQAGVGVVDGKVVGWYGNSALESAIFGIPTIAHLSGEAFEGAARGGIDMQTKCALINTPRGPSALRSVISEFFAMTYDDRRRISLMTRRWVEEFHSYPFCARELAKLYDRLR